MTNDNPKCDPEKKCVLLTSKCCSGNVYHKIIYRLRPDKPLHQARCQECSMPCEYLIENEETL